MGDERLPGRLARACAAALADELAILSLGRLAGERGHGDRGGTTATSAGARAGTAARDTAQNEDRQHDGDGECGGACIEGQAEGERGECGAGDGSEEP